MADRIVLEYEVLTPMYMGDADLADGVLRPPSFKGLLRFWFRAVAPDYVAQEAAIFGGTSGQSRFLLRVRELQCSVWKWDNRLVARLDSGQGKETRNGLRYLGYPFDSRLQKGMEREAIGPGSRFALEIVFPVPASQQERRAVLAAAWLLGHVGGAGSRSRRGFGSLALRRWGESPTDGEGELLQRWPEWSLLPLLHPSADHREWISGFNRVKKLFLEDWFQAATTAPEAGVVQPDSEPPGHPHLSSKSRTLLAARGDKDWATVLQAMGRKMQDFRVRKAPDYQHVKDHLTGVQRLEQVPDRAAFGLPLTFRYSSVRTRPITFVPYDQDEKTTLERHGSLLHLRVVALADGLHPLFLRLDGAIPGQGKAWVAPRGDGRPLRQVQGNLLDRFMDHLMGKN